MREDLEKRLAELQAEHQAGRQMLAELDGKRAELLQTMLRIEGAVQVLTELLQKDEPETQGGAARL